MTMVNQPEAMNFTVAQPCMLWHYTSYLPDADLRTDNGDYAVVRTSENGGGYKLISTHEPDVSLFTHSSQYVCMLQADAVERAFYAAQDAAQNQEGSN